MHGGGDGGMMGSGGGTRTALTTAAKLTRCDEHVILSVRTYDVWHLLGLVFLVIGSLFLAIGLYAGFLPFLGIGPGVALYGYVMIAPATLDIDVAAHTYKVRYGWWPLCREMRGGCEDFARLSLSRAPVGGKTALQIRWRDKEKKPYTLHTASREEAQQYKGAVASLLGMSGLDAEGKSTLQPEPEGWFVPLELK